MTDLTNILGIALIGVGAASAVYGTILCYSVKVLLIAKKNTAKFVKNIEIYSKPPVVMAKLEHQYYFSNDARDFPFKICQIFVNAALVIYT